MSEELKPCPFCNQEARVVPDSEHSTAHTLQHHSKGCPIDDLWDWYPDKDQAVAAWNTRTPPRVKALVWEQEPDMLHLWDADGMGLLYRVLERYDGTASLRIGSMNHEHSSHENVAAAFSFANDHNTRRVLSCLEGYDD